MALSIPQAVATVRRVFKGDIKRDQAGSLSRRERAMIGLAIMMVFPEDYLDDLGDEKMHPRRNDLALVLHDLCGRGIDKYTERASWLGACRALNLYEPNPGRGGIKIYTLTAPSELQALVSELGATADVLAFKQAADAAKATEEAEARRTEEERDSRFAKMNALIESLTDDEQYVLYGLLKEKSGDRFMFFD